MRTGVLPDSNAIVTADYKRLVVNFSHCTLVADRRHHVKAIFIGNGF